MSPPHASRELAVLADLGDRLNRTDDFEEALGEALDLLVTSLDLGAGWAFLSTTRHGDRHEGAFRVAATSRLPPALAGEGCAALREGTCECQGRFRQGRLDRGVNQVQCSRLASARGEREGLRRHASVPLLGRGGPVGILNLARPGDGRFGSRELAFLESVARQLGTAFDRARLQRERTESAALDAALEERRRWTHELHDSVAQGLFATQLQLRLARDGHDRDEAVARAETLLDDAQRQMQALVEAMRPPDLDAGLLPALERLARRGAAGARVHLDASAVDPPRPAAEATFRTAQEGLRNALRHGRAERVWLQLGRDPGGGLTLSVRDDGVGCDPTDVREGLGLSGLRTRTEGLGGTLELRVPEGTGGCELLLRLPATALEDDTA